MKRICFFALCAAVAAAADFPEPMQKMRVTGDRVNLRSRPSLTGELTGQVRQGDELNAYPVSGDTLREWRAVEAPEWVECWVRGDYLEGDEVVPETLNVRAGPSLNYGVIAVVKRGERVTIKATDGEWTQIGPPPGSAVWISTAYIEPVAVPTPEEPAAAEETAEPPGPATEQPAADVVDIPVLKEIVEEKPPTAEEMLEQIVAANSVPETDETESATPLPVSFELDTARPQGTPFSAEGQLRKTHSPLLHRLTDEAGKTICFVRGNREQMTQMADRRMRMTGRSYSLREAQTPVLVPERIILQPVD